MALDLKGDQIGRLRDALISAFSDYTKLDMMVTIEVGERLPNIAEKGPLPAVAFNLIVWAMDANRVDELVAGALKAQPRNRKLVAFAQEVALTSDALPKPQLAGKFEAMFLAGAGLQDVAQWRARMEAAERCVCRIDMDVADGIFEGIGTGFLIAPSLVLTNEHVAARLGTRGGRALFDYKGGEGAAAAQPRIVKLASNWRRAASDRHALDYTVIELAEPAASDDVGDRPRGHLRPANIEVAPESPLFILQHAEAGMLKVCVGVAKHNQSTDHLYYTTNTKPGSSGSPVFTIDWRLVALHHFADDSLLQNRGIRMSRVLADIHGKDPSLLAGS